MPVLARRNLLNVGMELVASYAIEYVHPEHLEEWLLNLEWERDVASIDPDWYRLEVQPENPDIECISGCSIWPIDRNRKISIDGYHRPISKGDMWVLMFWKRRGEFIFNSAKTAVQDRMEADNS